MSARTVDFVLRTDAGVVEGVYPLPKNKLDGTAAPTAGDDDADGFVAGSLWVDRTNDKVYVCRDNATGAALWLEIGSGSGTYTDEQAQDAVGTILLDSATVDLHYDDATPSLTVAVKTDSVGVAYMHAASDSVLFGRSSAGSGPGEEISFDTFVSAGTFTAHTAAADPHAGYVLESLIDAKGDLLAGTADNTPGRLAVGSDGQVLTADSTAAAGVKWAAPVGGAAVTVVVSNAAGGGANTGTIDVSAYTTLELEAVSGGGGGGSGRLGASATSRMGGNGGNGGNYGRVSYRVSDLGLSAGLIYYSVPAQAAGGAGVSVSNTNGNAGNDGGVIEVRKDSSTGTILFYLPGGWGGNGGLGSNPNALNSDNAADWGLEVGSTGGRVSSTVATIPGDRYLAPTGGEGGALISTGNVTIPMLTGSGTVRSRNSNSGSSPSNSPVGAVGGAGATAAGGAGVDGNSYGGGGGGGAAQLNGGTSGAGGAGGKGVLRIVARS